MMMRMIQGVKVKHLTGVSSKRHGIPLSLMMKTKKCLNLEFGRVLALKSIILMDPFLLLLILAI